jgi:hypothetical protein
MSNKHAKPKKRQSEKNEPVSLHPLDPKEALADLMKIKPEPKTGAKKPSSKKGSGEK